MNPPDSWKKCESGKFKNISAEIILHIANYLCYSKGISVLKNEFAKWNSTMWD
jgi:hypothetical protein